MTDTSNPARVEPTIVPPPPARASDQLRAVVDGPGTVAVAPATEDVPRPPPQGAMDQLSRIEEKSARLEEKMARSEAHMLRLGDRVEQATGRMNEAARQADLAALRNEVRGVAERVRRVPGYGTMVVFALLTALLAAAAVVLAQRYGVPGLTR